MKIIAHRGNIFGPDDMENSPKHIEFAIHKGYDAEIDLWRINGVWYSGHDQPFNKIDVQWLDDFRSLLWCHAKNLDALWMLLEIGMHCFWHQQDAFTLTSQGFIWAHQDIAFQLQSNPNHDSSIVFVHPGRTIPVHCYGVCTDYAYTS